MANDRLGIRWGLAGGTTLATTKAAHEAAAFADAAGFDSFWISNAMAVDPIVALASIGASSANLSELGTSVVPLFGRHPVVLAQQALTAQSALDNRFTLGIGAGSKSQAEDRLGLSWDKPFSFTREFVEALDPLLAGQPASVDGQQLSAHAELSIEAPPPPILLAALGPKMLEFAGAHLAGTTLGQCGPKTIASYIVPHLHEAAARAGRATPRIMALVRICVTDDHAKAFELAQKISGWYQAFPSYARVIEKEGLADPAELHLIGSWSQVLDGLTQYAQAGVTDLRLEVAAPSEASAHTTRAALAEYLQR